MMISIGVSLCVFVQGGGGVERVRSEGEESCSIQEITATGNTGKQSWVQLFGPNTDLRDLHVTN